MSSLVTPLVGAHGTEDDLKSCGYLVSSNHFVHAARTEKNSSKEKLIRTLEIYIRNNPKGSTD